MTVGTDLADEITANETQGLVDPVHTPVQYGHDIVDVLAEMVPVVNQSRAAIVAQFPFSARWKRGRIESDGFFKYQGETFNVCIVKHEDRTRQARNGETPWVFTVFLREHIGTKINRRRDGSRYEVWTWRYHRRQTFLSVSQAYDLAERLKAALRNEQELDDPYHTSFMGPEAPWDPHVLAEMVQAQEDVDRASEAHASVDWDSVEWTTVNLDATGAQ